MGLTCEGHGLGGSCQVTKKRPEEARNVEKSRPSSDPICAVAGDSLQSGSRQLGAGRHDFTPGGTSSLLNTQPAGRSAGAIHRSGVRPFNRHEADTLTCSALSSSPFHTVGSFICSRWQLPLPHGTAGEMVDSNSNTRSCHPHGRRNGAHLRPWALEPTTRKKATTQ